MRWCLLVLLSTIVGERNVSLTVLLLTLAAAWAGATGINEATDAGDIPDLYREYGLDEAAILDACAQALVC